MTYVLTPNYNERFHIPKPEFPFTVGKRLQVRPYIFPQAPEPFFVVGLMGEDSNERDFVNPVERCLLHPPARGPRGGLSSSFTELEIVRLVRAGDGHSAQLLAVRVLTSTNGLMPGMIVLAKLYDPLYADHVQDGVDPFQLIYLTHTQECAAYKKLEELQGNMIPAFYGSFTLSLPVDQTYTREVRLILIELIPGLSMDQLDPSAFRKSKRQAVAKSIIDVETTLHNRDVSDYDIHPGNIVVLPKGSNRGVKAIKVDFGLATTRSLPGVSISPLLRWKVPPEAFDPWIDWDWEVWLEKHYEHTKGPMTEDMQRIWGGVFGPPRPASKGEKLSGWYS